MTNLKYFSLLALGSTLTACVTYPPSTGFTSAPTKSEYGYTVTTTEAHPNAYISIYKGNKWTRSDAAFAYAMLAAYETCKKKGLIAYVRPSEDASVDVTEQRVSSYSVPNYHSDGTVSYSSQVYSYPVTSSFPNFFSIALCQKRFVAIGGLGDSENVSRELVHNVTKDFKGGLLVKTTDQSSKGGVQVDDVIIRVAGRRIEKLSDLDLELQGVFAKSTKLEVIRKQKILSVDVKVQDNSEGMKMAMEESIKYLCGIIPWEESAGDMGGKRPVEIPSICRPYPPHNNAKGG